MVKKAERSGPTLVAIGVSKNVSNEFKNSVHGSNLKQLVAKFISAYKSASDM